MKNKSQLKDTSLLNRALRIAALEAYISEVIETEMYEHIIGTDKEFPTKDSWIQDRIDTWLQAADILKKF